MSSPTNSFLSSKRPRIHKSKSGDETVTYESPDLWFDDGNIIIRTVLNDKTYTVYKVHKSILVSHSNVFHDLFDGPQTAFDVASERYEGLSVIELQDSPSEVNDFLKALYFPEWVVSHFELNMLVDRLGSQGDPPPPSDFVALL
jgi:BTB/POZ domain